jgi:predicted amidohydrolase YtcJ
MADEKADLVLHEGAVFGHPGSDSLAISGQRILAHGTFASLKGLVGPRAHLIRLGGRTVAPGFIDSHLHFMEGASVTAGVSLVRCRTISDLLADLRVAGGKTPPGNWFKAFGCDEALVRERRGPTRAELDHSVPRNPLRLRHQTLHASWLNSRAITALGLDSPDFKPPDGAILLRDATNALTGFVIGMEEWLSARMPRVTAAELEARARIFSRDLAAAGVTAFTDATVRNGPEEVATIGQLAASGSILQRTAVMVGPHCIDTIVTVRRAVTATRISLAGVKFMDVARWDLPRLIRAVANARSQDLDCAFHCTEVEELDGALIAIEASRERISARALEGSLCRIEHGGLIPPDYPERIAAAEAWVVSNPGFIYYRGAKYAGEPGLIPYLYRAKSLAATGIRLAAGSDAPVTPAKPLCAIASAISRVSIDGYELAPEEALEPAAALAMFTSSAARLARLAAGSIEPGRLADLIVLPDDPLTLGPADLIKMPIDLAIIGGRVVFERGRPITSGGAAVTTASA